jgi:hypothetical protein
MRIVPRTRSGRGLALAAVVLIIIDILTIWASRGVSRWGHRRLVEYGVSGGAVYVSSPYMDPFVSLLPRVNHAPGPREWWWRVESSRDFIGRWHGEVVLPLWHVWLPAVGLAAVLERRHAKRSRALQECDRRRYDLTGLPPGAVRPKCGQRPDRRDGASRFGVRSVVRSRGARVLAAFALVLIGLDLASAIQTFETSFGLGGLHINAGLDAGAFGVMTQPVAFVDQWGVDEDPALNRRRWWFMYFHWPIAGLGRVDGVTLPLWHLYIPLIACAIFLERRHAKRNRNSNACNACGYDLVGLPPEAVRPECGRGLAQA